MIFWDLRFDAISWKLMLELILRIVLAGICGAVVGFERSKRLKEAGLRTHCVVAIASALIMVISKYGFADLSLNAANDLFFAGNKGVDASRMAAQVISGIGFLGAGVIFKNGNVVRGITTAAGIWATAAIGMAFGSGMYIIGLFTTLFIMLVQIIMHKFPVGNDTYNTNEIVITMIDTPESRGTIMQRLKADSALIVGSKAVREKDGTRMLQITVKASGPFPADKMMELMDEHPEIKSISM